MEVFYRRCDVAVYKLWSHVGLHCMSSLNFEPLLGSPEMLSKEAMWVFHRCCPIDSLFWFYTIFDDGFYTFVLTVTATVQLVTIVYVSRFKIK